jgi:transposase
MTPSRTSALSLAVTLALTMPRTDTAIEAEIMQAYRQPGANAGLVAERFGVSVRTVYRIVGRLNGSGGKDHPKPQKHPSRARVDSHTGARPRAVNKVFPPDRKPGEPSGRREEGIARITELMVSGQWQSQLVEELAPEFGVSVHSIRAWAHDASVAIRATVDPHKVTAYWLESVDFLAEQAYEAKEKHETKLAIMAMSRLGQLCGAMIRGGAEHAAAKRTASESEKEAHQKLVELGWKPPTTFGELPVPDVDDPEGAEHERDSGQG